MTKEFIEFSSFPDAASEKEKREMIRIIEQKNKQYYKGLLKELKKTKNKIAFSSEVEIPKTNREEKTEECLEQENGIDTNFYLSLLKSCPSIDELPHYLPKRENSNFKFIINLLIASLLKEIVEIENFMKEEILSPEEKNEFLDEIKDKRTIMDVLIEYRDKKEISQIEEQESKIENTLVYLQSSSGNYYALADAKKLDIDYYESFLELLTSIKNGTFKNIKMFVEDGKIKGLLEVKNFKTRIVFQRLERDVYVILSMFMKKVDNDYAYRENLITRNEKYNYVASSLKKEIQRQEYLEEQKKVTNTLEKMLRRGGIDG